MAMKVTNGPMALSSIQLNIVVEFSLLPLCSCCLVSSVERSEHFWLQWTEYNTRLSLGSAVFSLGWTSLYVRPLIGLKVHWNVRLRKYPSQFLGSCGHVWNDNVLLLLWAEFSFLEILDAISIIPVSLSTGSKGLLDVAAVITDHLFTSEWRDSKSR